MLARKYRANKADIEQTIKNGYNIQGEFLYAKVSREKKEKTTFAIIISKKIEKTSVGRHLIKRRVSSAVEELIKQGKTDFFKTIVFFPKKTDKISDFKTFSKDVSGVFSKISK